MMKAITLIKAMCYDSSIAEKMQVVYIDHDWYEDDMFLRYFGANDGNPIGAFAIDENGFLKDGYYAYYAYTNAKDMDEALDLLHYIPDMELECGELGSCWLWRLDDCQKEVA